MTVVPLPTSRRSRASPRRRAPEIIEAAARVFAERGFHGATTQDIADVLGIRQASLYYYFPSKEGALELVCLQGVAGFFEVAKAIASGPGTAADKLARLIKSHLSPLTDRSDFVRVFLNERQHLPRESRRRIGKWSRGTGAGVRRRPRRRAYGAASSAPTSIPVWRCSASSAWPMRWRTGTAARRSPIDRISAEFVRLLAEGVTKRPKRRAHAVRGARSVR